jgi:hypothetical protein
LEEKDLYERSRMLLSIYRDVCWSTIGRAEEVHEQLTGLCGSQLDDALIYLETFAPDETRDIFEERICSLLNTKWFIDLVETAIVRIRAYPFQGDLYCEILSKCYLGRFSYTESELLEILHLERSSFYDRKKEAILIFGISMWGTAIPKMRELYEVPEESMMIG